ncbi:MAG: OmpA family protein [Cyclobacteriaceae bacterium]|nr:OmpA family protein [Cyclobacteriaceae bacterium]MCH8517647.1 OmpA family protein [Cyclobacteriaceae bacterium]
MRTYQIILILLYTFISLSVAYSQAQFSGDEVPVKFSGVILDEKTKEPIPGVVKYYRMPHGSDMGVGSAKDDGKFEMYLFQSVHYEVEVLSKGYQPVYGDLSEVDTKTEVTRTFELNRMEVGGLLKIGDILFRQNESEILEESFEALYELIMLLQNNPKLKINLEGHTDIMGSKKFNMKLSEKRVASVQRYLIDNGIDKKRVSYEGFGGEKPLVKSGSSEEREVNRRVEVRIVEV